MVSANRRPTTDASTTPNTESTPPLGYTQPSHDFTLQIIMELQKSTSQLTTSTAHLSSAIDKIQVKIDGIDAKLSSVTHKIYAATAVMVVLVGIGGFIVNKAWDLVVYKIENPGSTQV